MNIKAAIKEIIETVVFVVVMVILIKFFIGEIRLIPSASMKPTFIEGDRVFIERFSRFEQTPLYHEPQRGDIMVFYPVNEVLEQDIISQFARLTGFFCKDIAYIKRIVGVPGDKLEIKHNQKGIPSVYINGKELNEPYLYKDGHYIECDKEEMQCVYDKIPEGYYFMMGDNRGNSQDSRFWGLLPKERIIGKAVVLLWPLNRVHLFKSIIY